MNLTENSTSDATMLPTSTAMSLFGLYHDRDVYLFLGLMITIAGIVGNIVILVSVIMKDNLHTPMFAVIACLAIADFLAIISRLVYCCLLWYDIDGLVFDTVIIVSAFTLYSSCAHNILLAIVRFILLVYPFRYQGKFVPRKIIHYSCIAWSIAFFLAVAYGVFTFKVSHGSIPTKMLQFVEPTVMSIKFSLMFFSIAILHIIFVLKMRRNVPHNFARMTKQLSFVVTIVLLAQVLCLTPFVLSWIILSLFHRDIVELTTDNILLMNSIVSFALLLNHAINPIIYVILLRQVRHICCGFCKGVCSKRVWLRGESRTTDFTDLPEMTKMNPTGHHT